MGKIKGESDKIPTKKEIVFKRVFDAPRELVFKSWTEPKRLAKWWGPKGFTNPVCEVDAKPGGSILIHMCGPDGSVYPMTGVFHEINAPERLVFASAVPDGKGGNHLEVLNTVTFAEQSGRTTITLQAKIISSTAQGDIFLEGMEEGWTQSLERLAGYVTKPDQSLLVVVTHKFSASAEQVFDAWLDSKMIGLWMFGPKLRDEEILHLNVDPRVGGSFSFLVKREGKEIDHIGEYIEMERPHRLVFTWGIKDFGASSRVTIEITNVRNGCELKLTNELDPAWVSYIERTKEGWTKMIKVLADLLGG